MINQIKSFLFSFHEINNESTLIGVRGRGKIKTWRCSISVSPCMREQKKVAQRKKDTRNIVNSYSYCFEIVSFNDCNSLINEVVVEAVKEKIRVDCDEIDENEQCDQSVDCNFEKKSTGHFTEKLQNNPKIIKYYIEFKNYDHSMIYSLKFLVLQCIVWTLNVTRFLLKKSFVFSFDEIETSKRWHGIYLHVWSW